MKLPFLQRLLERSPAWFFTLYAMSAAFATYFCMYAFRKPFSAASYDDMSFSGEGVTLNGRAIEFKTALVIGQIIGYAISKYLGIKIVSEMPRSRRAVTLVAFILIAEAALLLFAVVPNDFKILALLINGLPLGMVWGLVVWYLEGRRTSELLLAGLSCSFILASGIVKDVGRALMAGAEALPVFAIDLGGGKPFTLSIPNVLHGFGEIPQVWMPFATGAVFLLPFLLSVFLLNQLPDPDREDVRARAERQPMGSQDRWAFIRAFLPGLLLLFVCYFFLTAYRDFRDNYGVEIISQLGYGEKVGIFSRTEVWVAFGVLAVLAGLNLIRDNRYGLMGAFVIMGAGAAMMAGATFAFDAGWISGLLWMILVGLGAYLAYVPFGSVLFDRMIAATRATGTAVFAIYVADALGYTGSIFVQLYKDFFAGDASRLEFFRSLTYFMAALGVLMFLGSAFYFWWRTGPARIAAASPVPHARAPTMPPGEGSAA